MFRNPVWNCILATLKILNHEELLHGYPFDTRKFVTLVLSNLFQMFQCKWKGKTLLDKHLYIHRLLYQDSSYHNKTFDFMFQPQLDKLTFL